MRRLLPKIEAAVAGIEGVDRVVTGAELAALGLPDPATSDQAPDLVVAVRDGYDVGRADTGRAGRRHRRDARRDTTAPSTPTRPCARLFLAWGRDVKPGVRLGDVRAIDVAPTIAEWLGVTLPTADGTSLARALAGN